MPAPLDALTQINLDDLVNAFGFQDQRLAAAAVRLFFRGAARKFAHQMIDFDADIASHGLAEAARRTERIYVRDLRLYGRSNLPAGPVLALSNHPGMTDTLALFAALGLPQLKIIALNRPFLLSLPHLSRQLFFVTDDPSDRVALIRHVSSHLRNGGSLLTFPAGHTEPDPDVYPGALESLSTWTDSAAVFLRFAPQTAIVPLLVRSVVWKRPAHSPLVRLKRTRDERELLVVAVQLLMQVLFNLKPVTVKVQIGRPVSLPASDRRDSAPLHQAILEEMKSMIAQPASDPGESVL